MDNSPINNKHQNKYYLKKEQDILRSNIYKYYNDNSSFNNNSNLSNCNLSNNINTNSNLNTKNLSNNNNNSLNNINQKSEKEKIEVNQKKAEISKAINEETNQYIEEMKKGTYNILVTVRCRPLNQKEREISLYETLQIMERKIIILKDPNGASNPNNVRTKEQTLAFDYAFDQFEGQNEIFSCTTKFLIKGVTNGFNATVFAYGATGAGKTYTMLGNEENPGIMSLTLNELFNKIKSYPEREYTVKLWYLEIYNENIRDLLVNNSENLELREDPNKGLVVNGITEMIPKSSEHILNILKKGNRNRTTESTNANETSSRSHAILQIMVSYKEKASGVNYEIKYGKLNLIDLAGSERASMTKNKGVRLFEGANINKSLLTLGNCINALCEANEKGIKTYVPYRDSKLTRLLKDSLGGNARTVMIANVSPFINSFDDTYNTLKYADRAKHIKTNIKRNVLNGQYHITNYLNVIKNLQNRIFELENQISINKKRDFTASPKMSKKDLIENSFQNNSNNKKKLNRNSFICFESDNLRIIREDEKEIKNNSLFNFEKKNSSNNNSKICLNDKEDKELEMKYNSLINEFIISTKKEIKLKEKVMTLQQELFLINNSINLTDNNGSDTTELKNRAKNIKNLLHNTIKFLEEYSKRNDKEYNLLMEDEELKLIYKNYLTSINNNIKLKTENIDMKLKLIKIKTLYNNLTEYINDLEEQIEIRDCIISKNSEIYSRDNKDLFFKVLNKEQISRYLNLEQIKKKNNSDLNIQLHNNNYYNVNKKLDIIKKSKKRNDNLNININDNDSYSMINNQYFKNANSTEEILPVLSEAVEIQKAKRNREEENNKLYLPPLSLKINNTYSKDNNNEDIYNKSLKSMLNDIQAINSDISFKLNKIEQNSIKIKNSNTQNMQNNQINSINNNKNMMNHFLIPKNNTFKTKNIIGNLLKKDNDKTLQPINRFMTNKGRIKCNLSSKKLKNVPSAGNMKQVNNSGNNNSKNNNYIINKENKNIIANSPWNAKNEPLMDVKNNKFENRAKSSIARNVKTLPRSAKSRGNSKNQKKEQNNSIENKNYDNKKNENKEKTIRINEMYNKGKEENNNNSIYDESKNYKNNYFNNKRNNKFQNSDIDLHNYNSRKSNSFGNDNSCGNIKGNKSIEKNKKNLNCKIISKEKEKINKQTTPFYRSNKSKNKITQEIII